MTRSLSGCGSMEESAKDSSLSERRTSSQKRQHDGQERMEVMRRMSTRSTLGRALILASLAPLRLDPASIRGAHCWTSYSPYRLQYHHALS